MVAEDVRNLQSVSSHDCAGSGRRSELKILQRAFYLAQQLGSYLAIASGILKLLVPEEHLNHADILVAFQQMGGEGVSQ
jgi:hypothetical protein